MFGRKQERNLRQTATKELLSCSLKHSYALVFFICTLHRGSELEGFTRRNRKGNKERGGLRCRKSRAAAREEQGGAEADGDCPCLSGPLFSSVGSRKAGLSRVAQVPFIGLTSMTSRRFRWSSSVCPGSHHPQGRRVSWAGVAGRARIQNTGLGSERGSGGCRICRVTGPSR